MADPMFRPSRMSFRQLLLVAFLAVAGLLAAVSLRGLYALDQLGTEGRAAAERAAAQRAAAQRLAEQGVDMERAARQFLVLGDPALRQRFEAARADATAALDGTLATELPPDLVARWRTRIAGIAERLDGPRGLRLEDESALAPLFRELEAASAAITAQVRQLGDARTARLQDEFEAARRGFAQQVLGAIVLAAGAAVGFGVWLARPLRRLEQAVLGLGENRLDQPVQIDGPADLRSLGQRLEWLRLRLQELDEDKARFLRHVSHELKTPLAALREGVALLEDGVAGALTDDQREVARILAHNTRTLQAQIEDLLRFNAAAFAARRLSRRPVELRALMQQVVDAQRLQWQARQLQVRLAGEPVSAAVDAEQLSMALANLLSNAIRYSPVGGGIELGVATRPGAVWLDVADQGPGVAEGDRARIFEPFYRGQTQPDDAVRGSGIGLSIVREVVHAHGGQVSLLEASHGAHFRIELPHATD